ERSSLAPDAVVMSDVDAFYGDSHVLRGVSLRLGEGRLLGLLGRNGAGKATTLSVPGRLWPARHGAAAPQLLRSLPPPARAPAPVRRLALGRRAADARDRSRADVQSPGAADGRAVEGTGPPARLRGQGPDSTA